MFQDAESNKKQKPSAPKEAWVLRWLMKKLKASSPQREELQTNYRLHTQTWILLRQLLERIPIKPLAFILNEHKFLQILKHSLADIMDASNASPERLGFQESLHSESSATIQGSPVSEALKRGQKRKRTENGLDSVEPQGAIRGSWIDTFCAVLKSVKTLVALAHEFSGVESASHSHLQLVLRGEPQTAAAILGQSFVLTRKVVEKWDKRFPELHAQLMRALSATLDIWRLSSERLCDATNLSSDVGSLDLFSPDFLGVLTFFGK